MFGDEVDLGSKHCPLVRLSLWATNENLLMFEQHSFRLLCYLQYVSMAPREANRAKGCGRISRDQQSPKRG